MKKTKKLVLSAETIRQLSDRELRRVGGGGNAVTSGANRTGSCPTSDPVSFAGCWTENSCTA
jgi:natural product precursor